MPARKKKKTLIPPKIKVRSKMVTFLIDYKKVLLLISPIFLVVFVLIIILFFTSTTWQNIKDFFTYNNWEIPFIQHTETSTSATQNQWFEDPDVVIADPPELPEIDETKETAIILDDIQVIIDDLEEHSDFTFTLLSVMREEALADLEKGVPEEEVQAKLVEAYKLAQEMQWAYYNKLMRFRETTQSSQ